MKKNISVILFLFIGTILVAQSDSITFKKNFFGTKYYYHQKFLSYKEIDTVVAKFPEAKAEMKLALKKLDISIPFSAIGGGLIGGSLGYYFATKDFLWILPSLGITSIALSYPFSHSFSKHTKNAVEIYNREISKSLQVD